MNVRNQYCTFPSNIMVRDLAEFTSPKMIQQKNGELYKI